MDSEQGLQRFLSRYASDTWTEHSAGYQMLLEQCGDKLLPALLECAVHPQPEIRAAAASLLATRRPHTQQMVQALARLTHDPEPLVRIRALESLKEFGDLAADLVDEIYDIVREEKYAEDQVPRILAMGLLLHLDHEMWKEEFIPELTLAATSKKGDLAEYLAMRYLLESNGQEMPSRDDDVSGHGELELDP
jgi:HEAT repeat protein